MTTKDKKIFIINTFYLILIIGMIYITFKYIFGFLGPFIIGFLVSYLLKNSINQISKKLRISRKIIAVILVLFFYLLVGFLLILIVIGTFAKFKELIANLPQVYATEFQPLFNNVMISLEKQILEFSPDLVQPIKDMSNYFLQSLGNIISSFSSNVINVVSAFIYSVPGVIISTILAIISSVFFAIDHHKITKSVINFFPKRTHRFLLEIKGFITEIGITYIKSYSIILLLSFIELAIGLSLLKVKSAIIIAALIALVDILPVIGTGAILLPWSIIALIQGNTMFGLKIIAIYLIITIVRNIVEPKLIGNQIGIHPLIMLISMYVGVNVFGFLGLFIFPILVLVLKYLYEHDQIRIKERT